MFHIDGKKDTTVNIRYRNRLTRTGKKMKLLLLQLSI
jgi:hypothetical protein